MTLFERLVAIRTGGGVERCHGIRHQGSYSNAAHSWGVAMLMYLLWPQDFARLAIYCLVHDVPEAWVGDIPATTKKFSLQIKTACEELDAAILTRLALPNDADLSPEDQAKLKACDHLELYLWAKEQVYGGNRHASCICREVEGFFRRSPLPEPAQALYEEVRCKIIEHATDDLIRELTEGNDVGYTSAQRQ